MLSRIISLHSRTQIRLIYRTISPSNHSQIPKLPFSPFYPHKFSTHNNNGGNGGQDGKNTTDLWKISQENDNLDDIFGTHVDKLADEVVESKKAGSFSAEGEWGFEEKSKGNDDLDDIFGAHVEKLPNEDREPKKMGSFDVEGEWALGDNVGSGSGGGGGSGGGVFDEFLEGKRGGGGGEGEGETEFQPWQFGVEEDDGKVEDVFGIGDETGFGGDGEDEKSREEREMVAAAEKLQLEKEEQSLLEVIKGPDRAFGDLVAASGITDAMLDSLIALKNFQDIEGLPPLSEIEDERYLKTLKKSSRYELELQKQEDAAKARVRKVDEKGRAYGTGKRKSSIARVWIQPGEGKFFVNDKEFDVYFPMLDHRATLLRPFSETKTLGLWDVKCTVKGGGTTGQVGAIRLGVSRALQNWEPGLRPPLKEAGFLTRDPRIVERKKPGKAKARKSFQWVKR